MLVHPTLTLIYLQLQKKQLMIFVLILRFRAYPYNNFG